MIPFLVSKNSRYRFYRYETEKEALILEKYPDQGASSPLQRGLSATTKPIFISGSIRRIPSPLSTDRAAEERRAKYFGPYPSSSAAEKPLRFSAASLSFAHLP